MIFAGQHTGMQAVRLFLGLMSRKSTGTLPNRHRKFFAMNDPDPTTDPRIKDLEGAARKARLEAMQIAAQLIAKESSLLAGSMANDPDHKGDLATLRARYEGLVRKADDAQALIDKMQADEHDKKYHR
jgi:hypothetical protein